MAETKQIASTTEVTIEGTLLDIFTYYNESFEEFLGFFIKEILGYVGDVSFAEGELGYSIQGLPDASFRVNDSGEFIANDLDADPYSIDNNGELIYDDSLGVPIATAASDILESSFIANWNIVAGAIKYYLDVSEDSQFNSYVPGYQNLDVGDVLEYEVSGLTVDVTYYYRVRAYNDIQISSDSNIISVDTAETIIVDGDGNIYTYVTIGTQQWLVENLKTTKYNDGTPISNITDDATWAAATAGAYCWYDNDAVTYADYGCLYNWYAVETGKLAPTGWGVPSDSDIQTLIDFCGGDDIANEALREVGYVHWEIGAYGPGTDDYGFKGLGSGIRAGDTGLFHYITIDLQLWTSTSAGVNFAWARIITGDYPTLFRYDGFKKEGMAVRCMRDI